MAIRHTFVDGHCEPVGAPLVAGVALQLEDEGDGEGDPAPGLGVQDKRGG